MVGHILKVIQKRYYWVDYCCGRLGFNKAGTLYGSMQSAFQNCPFLKVGTLRHISANPHSPLLEDCPGALTSPLRSCSVVAEHCPRERTFRESPESEKQSCLLPWSWTVHHSCSWNQRLAKRMWHGTPHASTSVPKSNLMPIFSNSLNNSTIYWVIMTKIANCPHFILFFSLLVIVRAVWLWDEWEG